MKSLTFNYEVYTVLLGPYEGINEANVKLPLTGLALSSFSCGSCFVIYVGRGKFPTDQGLMQTTIPGQSAARKHF